MAEHEVARIPAGERRLCAVDGVRDVDHVANANVVEPQGRGEHAGDPLLLERLLASEKVELRAVSTVLLGSATDDAHMIDLEALIGGVERDRELRRRRNAGKACGLEDLARVKGRLLAGGVVLGVEQQEPQA
jgi:hypothetical protein